MRLDVDGVRRVRVRRVRGVRRLAALVAALRVEMRVRTKLVTMLAVRALLVLEVPQPLVVPLDLLAERRVFYRRPLLVQLQAPRTVQPLKVYPTSPSHAHPVHYESRHNVHLITIKIQLLPIYPTFKKIVRRP